MGQPNKTLSTDLGSTGPAPLPKALGLLKWKEGDLGIRFACHQQGLTALSALLVVQVDFTFCEDRDLRVENWLSQSGASTNGSHGWLLPGHQEAQPDAYAFQQTHPENFLFSVFFVECKIKFFFFKW